MNVTKKQRVIDFIPCMASAAVSAVCLLIYFFAFGHGFDLNVIKGIMVPVAAAVVPVVNLIFRIRIPFAFNIAVAAFAVCGLDFASLLNFYHYVPYYDKFLHTAFGIAGAFGVMIVLLYGKGETMRPWCFFLVVMLCVLGLAACWEIFEYIVHAATGADMQHWTPDMSAVGDLTVKEFFEDYNPLWDTIWDVIVAMFGVLIYYFIIFMDKVFGYKICRGIYRQVNTGRKSASEEEEPTHRDGPPAE